MAGANVGDTPVKGEFAGGLGVRFGYSVIKLGDRGSWEQQKLSKLR